MTSLNYNLRNSNKNGETTLFAVVRVEEKQHKIAVGKLHPSHWSKRRQVCIIDATASDATVMQLAALNEKITAINAAFYGNFRNFAAAELLMNIKEITMANAQNLTRHRGITATKLIKGAFAAMYASENKTKSIMNGHLKKWLEYVEVKKKTDGLKLLSQQGINEYKAYLLQHNTANMTNKYVELLVRLIKHAVANDTRNLGLAVPVYTKIKDTRNKKTESKHICLTEGEITALEAFQTEDKDLMAVRDFALLQMAVGYRVSDLKQLLLGKYEIHANTVILNTEKENIKSTFPLDFAACIEPTLERYARGEYTLDATKKGFDTVYNKLLKELFKAVKLDRPITYTTPKGETETKPLYAVISSHSFRVSGATRMLRKYKDKQLVIRVCGWADTKMLDEIYSRLNNDDEVAITRQLLAKATKREVTAAADGLISEYKRVCAMLGVDAAQWYDSTDLDALSRLVHRHEIALMDKYGVAVEDIKKVFNDATTLEEKREIIRGWAVN